MTMKIANFRKLQVLTTLASLLPIVMYLVMWNSLPAQMQANIMPTPLLLSRTLVAFVIPAALAIIHLIVSFAIVDRAKKENNPRIMWLCWLMPLVGIIANIPLLLMNI